MDSGKKRQVEDCKCVSLYMWKRLQEAQLGIIVILTTFILSRLAIYEKLHVFI